MQLAVEGADAEISWALLQIVNWCCSMHCSSNHLANCQELLRSSLRTPQRVGLRSIASDLDFVNIYCLGIRM
jgi:hypothetical protein